MTRPLFNKDRISDFDNFERHAAGTIAQIKTRLREGYPVDFQVGLKSYWRTWGKHALQDVVARFTLDSATEYLFGKDVNSMSAGLPYPAGSPLADHPHFVNHPSNAFVKAFAKGQEKSAVRLQGGRTWPLREFWADAVKPSRKVVDEFVQPMLAEALERKAKGVKTSSSEKDIGENMSLLDRLVENTDSMCEFLLIKRVPIVDIALDTKDIQDELLNILVAGRDTVS